ncbi:MAG: glyoxylate/hydroxypyruvate reductase A [Saprospiraceae bacterium]|nr:glyoxylate/hydroxypyruvate reductase A [Saprospiraceae bacterium]
MSIVLICNNKDPKPWAEGLSLAFPDTRVEIFPNVKNKAEVTFAVCWKPKPGDLQQFPALKVVQSLGAGVEHILQTTPLLPHLRLCRIVDPGLANDMWEFTLATVMNHLKKLRQYQQQQQNKSWQQHGYGTIADTRIGVLGLGKIGALVAERFAQLGFPVSGWSASAKNIPGVTSFQGEGELARCLAQSDILINLLPLTDSTTGILNMDTLKQLPQGAYVINVGRGGHLVDEDLLSLLDSVHLGGALLDVFHQEPLPNDHPFWTHPKVSITPHIASLTNKDTAMAQIIENYQRLQSGEPLLHQVQIQKGY